MKPGGWNGSARAYDVGSRAAEHARDVKTAPQGQPKWATPQHHRQEAKPRCMGQYSPPLRVLVENNINGRDEKRSRVETIQKDDRWRDESSKEMLSDSICEREQATAEGTEKQIARCTAPCGEFFGVEGL
uniref:Uncharacterized protein n=1 Tax=Heterorhabditis bacteriophora TaxID=37862 RepID=A0A1I7XGJ3_HETBA